MKKRFIYLVVSAFFVVPAIQIHAQSFKGLFDKEEAVFHVSVTPTAESGVAMVTLYFTHSKATTLEASLWIKDLGTNLSPVGGNRLVKDLWEMSNRKQDTIYIEGLANLHFYTIGLDFRTPQGLTPRFNTKILSDNYRYEYSEKQALPSNAKVKAAEQTAQPCITPDISVRAETNGYCGAENRPAVVIECLNCKGKTWSFSVEYSSNGTNWRSLRSDGKSQTANGNAIRTEPLCILPDGEYKLRVSATGENCTTPVYHYLGTPLRIGGKTVAPAEIENNEPPVVTHAAPLPDTCAVMAEAILIGNEIRGQVILPSGSPCGDNQPYAQVRYVHPGHRDQNIGQVPLYAGKATPFQVDLDAIDLKRSIHTLQVVVFASPGPGKSALPISTSWIKAETRQDGVAMNDANIQAKGLEEQPVRKSYTRLQDLRPVYLSVQSDIPAYIAWTNPAECINGGCVYTVWAGKSNGPIRLLANGKQGGSLVKESLEGLTIEERYLEVEVETKSGSSIASYVFGQGPNFNFGENYVHRERIIPVAGKPETAPRDMLVAQPTPTPVDQLVAKGKVQNSEALVKEETPTGKPEPKMVAGTGVVFEQPQLPVSTFSSCKYQREISVVGDMPINAGDWMVIKYNFSEPGYKYTLYFQPEGQTEWFITPGTKELQDKPEFYLEMTQYHTGRYAVLAYSFQNRWGCLSTPLSEALLIKVEK